jgi:hypothetical protein
MRLQRMIADRRRIARPLPYPSISARPARKPARRQGLSAAQSGRTPGGLSVHGACRSAEDPDHENRLRRGLPNRTSSRRVGDQVSKFAALAADTGRFTRDGSRRL